MKDHLRQLISRERDAHRQGMAVREYLQARILLALQDAGVFTRWAFISGTALRFLHGLPRFSEDLDFSLIRPGEDAGFGPAMARCRRDLEFEGYRLEIKINDRKTVATAAARFPGLPHELGLSGHRDQVLSVKVELDTNPPAGAVIATSVIRRHVTLRLGHHDQASLLAGKLHAVLSRPWTKGRDLYDLAWYLADRQWPPPNLTLLNAALAQGERIGGGITAANWRQQLRRHLATVDWDAARADVAPFLERPEDLDLVAPKILAGLLSRKR